jgi:hypothetical protein
MLTAYYIAIALSAVLFLHYGGSVLFSDGMVREFERFGLARFRRLTGSLEILGAVGLLVGIFCPAFAVLAAAGLALLMLLGTVARVRVGDSISEMLPAIVLLFVNAGIIAYAVTGPGAPGGG